nr:HD domain-containing protein [Pseudobutyrivibrio sp.]
GGELLSKNDGYLIKMAREIAVQHHERWNGNGYPANLKGNDISIYAQIVSVTDVYDALTSKRSYKESWEPSVARKEIIDQRGKQFSPKVVDAFITCYDKIEEIRTEYSDAV